MNELFASFGLAMLTGVLCIYIVLVLLFKDFVQPVTILGALVLSIPGRVPGAVRHPHGLSMPSMIGLIMLMGIATKNSILLIDYVILARRDHGLKRLEAMLDACHKRARPIVMTTIAMGAGMLPIALGIGTDPSFRAPMAIVVIGGLITSTFLSLLVIPVAVHLRRRHGAAGAQPVRRRARRVAARQGRGGPDDESRLTSLAAPRVRRGLCCCGAALAAARRRTARAYRVIDFDWPDPVRQRAVPVRLYLPAQRERGRPVPLVVFSHGIGGSRRGYSYLGSHWASQGFASLHLQHVGSDRSCGSAIRWAWSGGCSDAAQDGEAIARVQDLRFALDRCSRSERRRASTPTRIVAAGHSYGANTTLLAAGARVERQGQRASTCATRASRRPSCISAPPFYGESDAARSSPRHGADAAHHRDRGRDPHPRLLSRRRRPRGGVRRHRQQRKALAVFEGGSHSMFTDRAGTGGAQLNPQVKAATKALSLAFLRNVFDGDDEACARGRTASHILARFVGPKRVLGRAGLGAPAPSPRQYPRRRLSAG